MEALRSELFTLLNEWDGDICKTCPEEDEVPPVNNLNCLDMNIKAEVASCPEIECYTGCTQEETCPDIQYDCFGEHNLSIKTETNVTTINQDTCEMAEIRPNHFSENSVISESETNNTAISEDLREIDKSRLRCSTMVYNKMDIAHQVEDASNRVSKSSAVTSMENGNNKLKLENTATNNISDSIQDRNLNVETSDAKICSLRDTSGRKIFVELIGITSEKNNSEKKCSLQTERQAKSNKTKKTRSRNKKHLVQTDHSKVLLNELMNSSVVEKPYSLRNKSEDDIKCRKSLRTYSRLKTIKDGSKNVSRIEGYRKNDNVLVSNKMANSSIVESRYAFRDRPKVDVKSVKPQSTSVKAQPNITKLNQITPKIVNKNIIELNQPTRKIVNTPAIFKRVTRSNGENILNNETENKTINKDQSNHVNCQENRNIAHESINQPKSLSELNKAEVSSTIQTSVESNTLKLDSKLVRNTKHQKNIDTNLAPGLISLQKCSNADTNNMLVLNSLVCFGSVNQTEVNKANKSIYRVNTLLKKNNIKEEQIYTKNVRYQKNLSLGSSVANGNLQKSYITENCKLKKETNLRQYNTKKLGRVKTDSQKTNTGLQDSAKNYLGTYTDSTIMKTTLQKSSKVNAIKMTVPNNFSSVSALEHECRDKSEVCDDIVQDTEMCARGLESQQTRPKMACTPITKVETPDYTTPNADILSPSDVQMDGDKITISQVELLKTSEHEKTSLTELSKWRQIPMVCYICGIVLKDVMSHIRDVHGKPAFGCHVCGFVTKSEEYLLTHCSAQHDILQQKTCKICGHKTKCVSMMNRHFIDHHSDKPSTEVLYCLYCTYETIWAVKLRVHVRYHHKTGQSNKCQSCPFETKWLNLLYKHVTAEHNNVSRQKRYKCEQCEYSTRWKTHLYKHIYDMHPRFKGKKVYACKECKFTAKYRSCFNKHMKDKHGMKDYTIKYSCKACKFETSEQSCLCEHAKVQHPTVKTENQVYERNDTESKQDVFVQKIFKCTQCKFSTRWQSHFYKHKKDKHSGIKTIQLYGCKECEFTTKFQSYLYVHVKEKHRLKGKDIRYFCEKCEFQTRWRSHYYKHRKDKHMHGVEPADVKNVQ